MPIENERKYVLLPKNDLGLMTDLELLGTTTVDKIEQGYLPGNARIRSIVNKYEYSYKSPDSDEWIEPATNLKFTYKLQIGTDLVEIETDLSQADYNRLIMVARNKIHDLYNANLYLIMAEVELPEGVDTPETIPAYITDNLLYAVERHDRRFDNANLSDADAVRATVAHIKYEIENPSISLEEYERNVNQSAQNNG
jgi:hypothetical protein